MYLHRTISKKKIKRIGTVELQIFLDIEIASRFNNIEQCIIFALGRVALGRVELFIQGKLVSRRTQTSQLLKLNCC